MDHTDFQECNNSQQNPVNAQITEDNVLDTLNSWYLNLLAQYPEIEEYWEMLTSLLDFTAAVILYFTYVVFAEPLTSIFVESRPLRYKVQGYAMQPVEFFINRVYDRMFDFEIEGGQSINPENLSLVISNHQSLIDYMTIAMFSKRSGLDNSTFFFVWKHCVRLPSLRVICNAWRELSNWRIPKIGLADAFSPLVESPWRDLGGKWVVVFPEVTPWTATAMLEHRAECAANGCPKLRNLLYPRFNAFAQTVLFLRDFPLSDVYDLTITYIDQENGPTIGIPDWTEFVFSKKKWKILIQVKTTSVSQLPTKEKHLTRWLEKQWYQKDAGIGDVRRKIALGFPVAGILPKTRRVKRN